MFAFLHFDVEGGREEGDDRVREFLIERNYLGTLILLVNCDKGGKKRRRWWRRIRRRKNKKNLWARRKGRLWRSWRRIPTVRQRPNTKRYRDKREKRARERVGSFSSTCRLHLFSYVYFLLCHSSPSNIHRLIAVQRRRKRREEEKKRSNAKVATSKLALAR